MERRPWLPFALMALLALITCLVAAYENDWWVFRRAPESHRPSYKFDPKTRKFEPWKQG